MAGTEIPEWVATFVGRLALENEMLRKAISETPQPPEPEPTSNGHLPAREVPVR